MTTQLEYLKSRLGPMPDRLYKFIPRRWGEKLLQQGSLRITTFYRCRDTEAAGPGRGDPGENRRDIFHCVQGSYLRPDTHPAAWAVLAGILGPQAASRAYVSNSMFSLKHDGPDMYMFCTTTFPSRGLQKLWRSDDGNDVWIEIFNPPAFFHALEQVTQSLGQFLGVYEVQYEQRTVVHGVFPGDKIRSQLIPPPILKPPNFRIEREWRGIWIPSSYPIEPETVVAPDLHKFCRLLREVKSPPIAA